MDEKRISELLDRGDRSYRGLRLDRARLKTQEELARRAGVSRPSVQAFESGRHVSHEMRGRIRRALAAAIVERDEERALLSALNLTDWGVVERSIKDLREKIEAGELDEDTALKALGGLLDRLRDGARA